MTINNEQGQNEIDCNKKNDKENKKNEEENIQEINVISDDIIEQWIEDLDAPSLYRPIE